MDIKLASVVDLLSPSEYKVHLACWNGTVQPLRVFVRDREEWHGWNTWRYDRDDFNRPFILSLIDFYPEPGVWLFGGVYRVLDRSNVNYAHSYKIQLVPDYDAFVGRLKIRFPRPGRNRSIKLEKYLDRMIVSELLKAPYSGERFPGYENINHDFAELETVVRMDRSDWRAALENVKGVYLIADQSNGKKYVGAAYGEAGIWARWRSYLATGHGHTDELTALIQREGLDYARENFRLCLLEYRPAKTDDSVIIERENFWKQALLTRGQFGYNKN